MIGETLLPFSLPSVQRKITAAFDGGRISSDGDVMLLALAERRLGVADKFAAEIADYRDPMRVVHALPTSFGPAFLPSPAATRICPPSSPRSTTSG
jgi:hypothetical protein